MHLYTLAPTDTCTKPIVQLLWEGWGDRMGQDESHSPLPSWHQVMRRRGWSLCLGGDTWLGPEVTPSGWRTLARGVQWAGCSVALAAGPTALWCCMLLVPWHDPSPLFKSWNVTHVLAGVSPAVPGESPWHLLAADVLSQQPCGQLANTAGLHLSQPSPAPPSLAAPLALVVPLQRAYISYPATANADASVASAGMQEHGSFICVKLLSVRSIKINVNRLDPAWCHSVCKNYRQEHTDNVVLALRLYWLCWSAFPVDMNQAWMLDMVLHIQPAPSGRRVGAVDFFFFFEFVMNNKVSHISGLFCFWSLQDVPRELFFLEK